MPNNGRHASPLLPHHQACLTCIAANTDCVSVVRSGMNVPTSRNASFASFTASRTLSSASTWHSSLCIGIKTFNFRTRDSHIGETVHQGTSKKHPPVTFI